MLRLAAGEVAQRRGRQAIEDVVTRFDGLRGVDTEWETWLTRLGVVREYHDSQACTYTYLGDRGGVSVTRWEVHPLIGEVKVGAHEDRRAFGYPMQPHQIVKLAGGGPGYTSTSLSEFSTLFGPYFDEGDLTARLTVALYHRIFE